jgi:hypothetical protein
MKIKTKDTLYNVLSNAGYSFHFTDCDGWIKDLGKGRRFHIVVEDDYTGEMHFDKTVNGKHKLVWCPELMGQEKNRIKKFDLKIKQEKEEGTKIINTKVEYADNIKDLIKTKVIKRKWFNPLRYVKGKFKYIRLK